MIRPVGQPLDLIHVVLGTVFDKRIWHENQVFFIYFKILIFLVENGTSSDFELTKTANLGFFKFCIPNFVSNYVTSMNHYESLIFMESSNALKLPLKN